MTAGRTGDPTWSGLAGALGATLGVQIMAAWVMLSFAAIAPLIAESFNLPAVLIGYQITIIYGVATATSLIAGAMVTRWGACRVSQICLVCCIAGCAIAAVPTLPTIAFASVILGFGYGLTNPSSTHLLALYTKPENRSLVFSIKQTGVPIGGIMAGLLTPWVAVTWGWQAAIAFTIPLSFLMIAALAPPREIWDRDRAPGTPLVGSSLSGTREVFADPALRWLCLCGFFFAAIQLCLMTFIVSMAMTELAFGAILAGTLLATVQASGVVGRLAWGYLSDRIQRNALILTTIATITALCCLALGLVTQDTPHWAIYAIAVVFGASAVGWNGVYIAEVVRLSPPAMVGRISGVASFSNFSGVLIGPFVFVQLYGLLDSYGAVYGLLTLPALLGGLGALVSGHYARIRTKAGETAY